MPKLSDIRAANPSAVPSASDQMFAFKDDGTPASYTLSELSSYFNGVSYPQWLTDSHSGCTIRMLAVNGAGSVPVTNGVIPFTEVEEDTGYYTSTGVLTIPSDVTRVEVDCGLKTVSTPVKISLIKNGNTSSPVATAESSTQYVTLSTRSFPVSAGDTLTVVLDTSNSVFPLENTYFSLRAVEKL